MPACTQTYIVLWGYIPFSDIEEVDGSRHLHIDHPVAEPKQVRVLPDAYPISLIEDITGDLVQRLLALIEVNLGFLLDEERLQFLIAQPAGVNSAGRSQCPPQPDLAGRLPGYPGGPRDSWCRTLAPAQRRLYPPCHPRWYRSSRPLPAAL